MPVSSAAEARRIGFGDLAASAALQSALDGRTRRHALSATYPAFTTTGCELARVRGAWSNE